MSGFVTIRKYTDAREADLAAAVLDDAGIDHYLDNRMMADMDFMPGHLMGTIALQVPEEHREVAAELLAAMDDRREASRQLAAQHPGLSCLACGTAMEEEQDTCGECGWSYADDEPGTAA
jgi:hypothetical protein